MKVLYEISNLGICTKPEMRTGIFRATQTIVDKIAEMQDIDFRLTSCTTFSNAVLTKLYLQEEQTELVKYFADSWIYPVVNLKSYNNLLLAIHNNKYQDLFNKLKRKLQTILFKTLSLSTKELSIEEEFQIYHSFFFDFPPLSRINTKHRVITIYDMIPLLFPEVFTPDISLLFQKIIDSIDIYRDWVICISESTKEDFCKLTAMPESRVFVTYLAASENFYREKNLEKIDAVRQKYKIPAGNYILGLSTLEPRKNTSHLIRCFFKLLIEFSVSNTYLVLVGSKGWLFDEVFNTVKSYPELYDKVIFTGRIPDEDLSCIYSGAKFFAYPSLYEGFGLPPLEAMQCGLPVITSNTSSLPEVVGDAAITIAPKDEDALCQAMWRLLKDDALCAVLGQKGILRAKQFSWEKCASDTFKIYNTILSSEKL